MQVVKLESLKVASRSNLVTVAIFPLHVDHSVVLGVLLSEHVLIVVGQLAAVELHLHVPVIVVFVMEH